MKQSIHPAGARLITPAQHMPQWQSTIGRLVGIDFLIVWLSVSVVGQAYHMIRFDNPTDFVNHMAAGLVFAGIFCIISIWMRAYEADRFSDLRRNSRQAVIAWSATAGAVLFLFFMFRFSGYFSRGSFLFLIVVTGALILARRLISIRRLSQDFTDGCVVARRAIIAGTEDNIAAYLKGRLQGDGIEISGTFSLRFDDTGLVNTECLHDFETVVRKIAPDDVVIVAGWEHERAFEQVAGLLMSHPAAVHVVPHRAISDFPHLTMTRLGNHRLVTLIPSALASGDMVVKRYLDIVVASLALVLLSPVMAVVAVAIFIESGGPVLYRQRRHGFNRQPFEMLKFRSLRHTEDTAGFQQVTRNDPRITRVGGLLRRLNLDELPQLVNVLRGDMSLVGPRPHPLKLDFESDGHFQYYSRRYNIRPGITGWAQVNGLRGQTDTPDKMQSRLECDLYYIDNWSLWFDLQILLLTVLSPRAFQNAV